MNIQKLLQAFWILAHIFTWAQGMGATPEEQAKLEEIAKLNTKYATVFQKAVEKLKAQGIQVKSLSAHDSQAALDPNSRGKIVVALLHLEVEGKPQPLRLQVNIEVGGSPVEIKVDEIMKKMTPHLPGLAIALADSASMPIKPELTQTSKEVSEKKEALEKVLQELEGKKLRAGSYYRQMAEAHEVELRKRLNGSSEISRLDIDVVMRKVVSLDIDTKLTSEEAREIMADVEFTIVEAKENLEHLLKEPQKHQTRIEDLQIDMAKLNYLVELMASYDKNIESADKAMKDPGTQALEIATLKGHIQQLITLETFLKTLFSTMENGLGQDKIQTLREALIKCYAHMRGPGLKGVYLQTLSHGWGTGAELAHLIEAGKGTEMSADKHLKLVQEVTRLKTHILTGMAEMVLEAESVKSEGRKLTETELKRNITTTKTLQHLRFQLSEVTQMERTIRAIRVK